MKIDILSIFPDMFSGVTGNSIIKKAIENERVAVEVTDFREYAEGKHHIVDDYPYGGGAGSYSKRNRYLMPFKLSKKNSQKQSQELF